MEHILNVAEYIFSEYEKISGEKIDEMKLHKLLYFAQRECIAITGSLFSKRNFKGGNSALFQLMCALRLPPME